MKSKKIALYFGAFLVVLVSFVLLAPQLFKNQIENAVKEASKEFITTPVTFKELNVSFFKNFPNLSVSLEHLSIEAPKEFNHLKTVETQSVDLGIDLFSLFGKQIKFTKLYVNEGKFNIVTDSLGNFSFGIFKTSDEPSEDAPFDLALDKIYVKNSNVLYQDDTSQIKIETKNTSIQGKIQVTDQFIDFDTQADILSLFAGVDQTIYVDGKPLKGKINTRVYLDPVTVEFKENDLLLAQLPIEIKGKMSVLEKGIDFDLNVHSKNASLAHLFSLVPKEYEQWYEGMKFDGTSDIQILFKGMMQDSVSKPNLNVDLNIAKGTISAKDFINDPVQNLNTKVELKLPQLNPDSLKINIPTFDFTLGKGFAKGKALYKMPMYIDAEVKSELDVTKLWKTLAIPGMKLGGNIALDGVVKGNYTTKTKKIKSGIEVTEIVSIPTFDVKSNWKNGFFQWNEMPMPIDFISFDMIAKNSDGNYKNTSVDLQNINTKAGSNYVKGRLKIDDLIRFNTDTDLQAYVNLSEIKKIVPIKEVDFAGELTIDTKAKGKLNLDYNKIPVTTAIVKIKNGFLKYNSLPDLPLEKINLETHITSPRGSLNDLRVNVLPISFVLAGEPFHIDAQLFNFHNLTFDIGTKGKLNLDNIYKVFAVDGWNVEGSLEADLKVKGKGGTDDSSSINNRGFVLMKNVRIKSDYFPHDFVFSKGRFNFFRNKIKMKDVVMKYDKQTFVLNGELENYINYFLTSKATLKGKLDVTTDYLDVNSFMAASANSSTSDGVVLLPDLIQFELSANAKKVKFNDMELKELKGLVKIADKKMDLEAATFELIDTPFQFSAKYAPINAKSALFDFNVNAEHFDIQKAYKEMALFRELVTAAESASGQVSLNYQLKGRLNADMFPVMNSIKGAGDLTLENIQFKGFKLFNQVAKETKTDALHDANVKNVVVKTSIENNVMTIERTKFKVAGFRPRIEGQVTLDGKMNLGMRLGLPPFGIIGIPITIKGNSDDFKLNIGKYKEEDLSEDDEDYEAYKKSLEVESQEKVKEND